jgi:hypothetical protein
LTTACAAMSHWVLSPIFTCKLLKEAAFHGAEADPQSSLKSKDLIQARWWLV